MSASIGFNNYEIDFITNIHDTSLVTGIEEATPSLTQASSTMSQYGLALLKARPYRLYLALEGLRLQKTEHICLPNNKDHHRLYGIDRLTRGDIGLEWYN